MPFAVNIPTSLKDIQVLIDGKIASVQAEVGQFLQQKERLLRLQRRASGLSKLPQSSSAAVPLLARTDGLIEAQATLEKDSMRYVQDGQGLLTTLKTDPFYQNLTKNPLAALGWSAINKIKFMTETGSSVAKNLSNAIGKIKAHKAAVDALDADISRAEAGFVATSPVSAPMGLSLPLIALGGAVVFFLARRK